MDERDRKTELLTGLFLFVGMVLLGLLILQFGSVREMFKHTYEITVPFADASGVREGTPVMLGGSKIGKVPRMPKLNAQFNGVIMDLQIYEDKKIPKDAKFSVGTAGLLGDSFIEIRTSGRPTESYIEPGTVLGSDNVSTTGGLTALQDTAAEIGKKADLVMDDMRAALKEVRQSMEKVNQDALGQSTIDHFKGSVEHLHSTMARLDSEVMSKENADNLHAAIADVKEAAEHFKRTTANLEDESKELEKMFKKLDPAIAKADGVMTGIQSTLKSIKNVADNLTQATKGLKGGDGLLKALLGDSRLKDDFADWVGNMKQHGVLFYRDSAEKAKRRADEEDSPRPPLRKR